MTRSLLTARFGLAAWYLTAVGLLFGIRALTTLLGGAGWELPGTGWRSVWQLVVVAIVLAGLAAPRLTLPAVGVVGAMYLLATLSELVDGTTLVGAIPVDMRDRLVHPLVGLLAVAVLLVVRRAAPRAAATDSSLRAPHDGWPASRRRWRA
ncbi:hypothetical protein [Pseudonocardia pini]|uniref:hypothetical protein n=1 Tax=Pseudonocardia pini TaxID=2758030 RepID=UPI0015F046C1|nr:hypothetical protein [Pseudonocardia pini]